MAELPIGQPPLFDTKYPYDPMKQGVPFDPAKNNDDLNNRRINTVILDTLRAYQDKDYRDIELWECFREDYYDWTKVIFSVATLELVQELRDYLRSHGCWVPRDGGRILDNL